MRISGFTMVKNATKLYYPIKASIASILPLVDEFVVALGDCDQYDQTREAILSLNSPKITIIDTVWDTQTYPRGMENAHQTDIAKSYCSGDWLFYLQADEVVHEQFLPVIETKCKQYLDDPEVEGFLFNYVHFWGDFWHYIPNHGWYPREIRIIRNDPDIHSWKSAQSFRRIPQFDGENYRQEDGTHKLHVVPLEAYIYHYGWVRPPRLMKRKAKTLSNIHSDKGQQESGAAADQGHFDYGDLSKLPKFQGTHPEVMDEWIAGFDWGDALTKDQIDPNRLPYKHEKLGNRILTFIEQTFFGHQLFGHSNWHIASKAMKRKGDA